MSPASKPQPARKLTTILNADVVGFSRLMRADEEDTLSILKERERLIHRLILEHHGRPFGTAGDSFMAEFASPVEAVRCAMACQEALSRINADLPLNRRFLLRIGVNLGDVMLDGDNLYGTGVNIAARLQTIADPGGICISQSVYDLVRQRLTLEVEDIGRQPTKNIAEPVQAYRVVLHDGRSRMARVLRRHGRTIRAFLVPAALAILVLGSFWYWEELVPFRGPDEEAGRLPTGEPSIVLLPFDDLSSDETHEYFADALTNDLTTDLSKFSDLLVISNYSAKALKQRPSSIRDVQRELGARYVLEGAVQWVEDRLRINVQLIDAQTDGHIWAERYDRSASDLFAVQDEIVETVVSRLAVNVTEAERRRVFQKETRNLHAYELWLQGRALLQVPEEENSEKARALFLQAIELDPNFARAYGHVSYTDVQRWTNNWGPSPEQSRASALALARKAVQLGPEDYDNWWSLGIALIMNDDYEEGIRAYERAKQLNPNDADLLASMSDGLVAVGRAEEAARQVRDAMRRNPKYPAWYAWNLGFAALIARRFDEAVEALAPITDEITPARVYLAAAYALRDRAGDAERAAEQVRLLLQEDPGWTVAQAARQPLQRPEDRELWLTGLRRAGLPEG